MISFIDSKGRQVHATAVFAFSDKNNFAAAGEAEDVLFSLKLPAGEIQSPPVIALGSVTGIPR